MINNNYLELCLENLDNALTQFNRGIPLSVPERDTFKKEIQSCINTVEDIISEKEKATTKTFYTIRDLENRINDYAFLNYYHLALDGKDAYIFFSFLGVKNFLLRAAIRYSNFINKKGN